MMTRAAVVTLILGLIVIGAGGVVGIEMSEVRRTRAAVAETDRRVTAMRARIAQLQRESSEAGVVEQALRHSLETLRPANLAAPTPVATARQAFDVNLLMLERPDLRPLYEASSKASEMEPYGWLIVSLTPEQAERFKSERLRHDQRLSEISALSRAQGWERDDPRRTALRRAEDELHAREMADVLGEAQANEYQEHEKTIRPRACVAGELAAQLYYTDTPLSALQAQALTQIVARNGADARGRFDFDAVNWEVVLRDARQVLTPMQFERLENLGEARRLQAQILALQRTFGARADGK